MLSRTSTFTLHRHACPSTSTHASERGEASSRCFACSLKDESFYIKASPRRGEGDAKSALMHVCVPCVVRCVYHTHTQRSGVLTARRSDSSSLIYKSRTKKKKGCSQINNFLVVALLGVRRSPAAAFSSSLQARCLRVHRLWGPSSA